MLNDVITSDRKITGLKKTLLIKIQVVLLFLRYSMRLGSSARVDQSIERPPGEREKPGFNHRDRPDLRL